MMQLEIVYTILALAFFLNLLVTTYIGKRSDLEKQQKLLQIFLVWLIPFIASISLWVINRNFDSHNHMHSKNESDGGAADTIGATSHYRISDSSGDSGE